MIITNIQRFSLHDGPGIRTTVFLKGCSLRCPWCSNPENINNKPQKYVKNGIEGIYGKEYNCDELYNELIKDKVFFGENTKSNSLDDMPGGVTFSGGECLLQIEKLEPLLKRLNLENINIAVETSLFVSTSKLDIAIEYVDLFYVDIKILEEKECKNILNGDLSMYMSNLTTLLQSGKPVVLRIPVIGGYTDGIDNRQRINELVKSIKGNIQKIEIIKEHNLGLSKYQSLFEAGEISNIPNYRSLEDKELEEYKKELSSVTNIPIEICKV